MWTEGRTQADGDRQEFTAWGAERRLLALGRQLAATPAVAQSLSAGYWLCAPILVLQPS
jgi:hypothetical protein